MACERFTKIATEQAKKIVRQLLDLLLGDWSSRIKEEGDNHGVEFGLCITKIDIHWSID